MKNKIIHNPVGVGNPYLSGPEERIPRFPSYRDKTIAGIVTEPVDNTLNLVASIQKNNGEKLLKEAQWVKDTDTSSLWQVELPSGEAFDIVEYSFHAGNIDSGIYSYALDGFHSVSGIQSCEISKDRVLLELIVGDLTIGRSFDFSSENKIGVRQGSYADIFSDENTEAVGINTDIFSIDLRDYQISINRDSGAVTLYHNGSVIYSEIDALEYRINSQGEPLGVRHSISVAADEKFYGFGERFNGFNQRGNILDVRVYEEYKSQSEGNRTYLPIPFFLSSGFWGHCINSPQKITYDLSSDDSWSFEAELVDWNLECFIYLGKPGEILKSQAQLTGFPVLPPDWAFGPWMSSNEWNSQKRVLKELHKSRELDIPATVLVIEAWSDEKNFYIWNDAEYKVKDPSELFSYSDFTFPEKGLWPDPESMIEDIHSDDTRLILWQIPVSKHLEEGVTCEQNARDKQYMIDKGYCVLNEDGSPYKVKPWWFTDSLVIDFTNPEAAEWWMDKRKYLIDELHIDGFKTDGGEHLWGRELLFADGRKGAQLWNEYPNHYINSYYKYINDKNGGISFSRSGFMGVQNSPVHWAGDQDSTWDAHRSILKAVLNTGISGVPFMGWDIGGFSGEIPSAELYLRSTAFACFGSIMQYHSEFFDHRTPHVDRTPWNIADRTNTPEVIDIYRYFAKLRMELIPYIKSEAEYSCESGSPLMKLMFFDYPEDPTCWELEDQYLFGRDLIVCPILFEGQGERDVYLPVGEWFDFFTGKEFEGGKTYKVDVPINKIPVFRKNNPLLNNISIPGDLNYE